MAYVSRLIYLRPGHMTTDHPPPAYPSSELLRAGPPDPDRDPDRVRQEKWCRVYMVVPVPRQREDGTVKIELQTRGAFAIPMAIRRQGVDLGSREAWVFF